MGEKKYNFKDDQSVADLLGSLPRVEAPANFDARVRSQIAEGRPASRTAWLIPSVAAVSLCSIVLAAVAFVYLSTSDPQLADVAQPENVPVAESESPNPQFAMTREDESANVIKQPGVSETPAPEIVAEKGGSPVRSPKTSDSNEGGGSYRTGLAETKAPIVPIGMPTPGATPEANVRPPGPINKVSAREVLQLIGLNAEFRNDGWHVKKVAENSLAGRSGVRDGDVIEAIDDVKVIGNTTFDSGFNGKNLTILRNGNRETISIRNQ